MYGKSSYSLRVVMGDHDVFRKDIGEKEKSVCRIRIHQYYANHHITDDLALLELCSPIKFSPEIQPIAIANPKIDVKFEEAQNQEQEDLVVGEVGEEDNDIRAVEEAEEQQQEQEQEPDGRDGSEVMVAGWGTMREGGSTARKLR